MGKRKEVAVTDVNEDSDVGSSVDSSSHESSSESEKETGLPLSAPSKCAVADIPTPQKKPTREAKKRRVEKKPEVAKDAVPQVQHGSDEASGATNSSGVKILKQSWPQSACSHLHLVLSFWILDSSSNGCHHMSVLLLGALCCA